MRLVQSTNGHHLVMSIYDAFNGEMVDCDLIDERESINDFINEFIDQVSVAQWVKRLFKTQLSDFQTSPILNNLDTQPPNRTVYRSLGGVRDAKDETLMQFGAFKRECRIYR